MPPASPSTPDLDNRFLLRRLFALAWQYRRDCLIAFALQGLLLGFNLSGLWLLGLGIDHLRHCVDPTAPAPPWPWGWTPAAATPFALLAAVSGAMLVLGLLRAGFEWLAVMQAARFVQGRIVVDLRRRVYDRLQRLSFRFFDAHASSGLINRVTGDVQNTRVFIDAVLLQGTVTVLSLLLNLAYMASIHPPLTLACLATTPAIFVLAVRFARLMRPHYAEAKTRLDRLVAVLSDAVAGVREVKGFAREPETIARFGAANDAVQEQNRGIFRRTSLQGPLLGFLTQVNLVVLLAWGGLLVIEGELPLGAGMIVFSSLLQQFSSQVSSLAAISGSLQECLASARRVFEVLETPVEVRAPAGGRPLARGTACAVEFDRVGFGYDPATPVLRELSFRVEAGECVAVLGATGAGKSTLLGLIARFHDPQAGRVLLDGFDAREFDLEDLRRNAGVVFQESFLFSHRIDANIAFGEPGAGAEAVERAARVAAAHDFIAALPDGYATVLGEGGQSLSGGQRQRLAIARAVLPGPGLLLLDDPTAAVDPETEGEILDALEGARAGRTTFVVAHRLRTLQRADRVLVLEDGRIAQAGRHAELLAADGPYRWMVASQLADAESLQLLARRETP